MAYSFSSIDLSRSAAENADKNFEIIQRKYSLGTASITDMADAQNEKFAREEDAVIAVYVFLEDLITFDRAVSHFYSLSSSTEQKDWLATLKERLASRGASLYTPNNNSEDNDEE
jgi:outer membrane protein